MGELRFNFREMQMELEALRNVARPFLERGSDQTFMQLRSQLENIQHDPGHAHAWEIPQRAPLRTRPSDGHYEVSGRGKHSVVGTLSFIWEITAERKTGTFALTGNASTRIGLFDVACDPELPLGSWRMEIGDAASPGYCFHAQIRGQSDDPPFPESLPVPRLPVFPPTPMAALEFLLGELFQTGWRREAGKRTTHTKQWGSIQVRRLKALLDWQRRTIDNAAGSPWVALKEFPDESFIEAAA